MDLFVDFMLLTMGIIVPGEIKHNVETSHSNLERKFISNMESVRHFFFRQHFFGFGMSRIVPVKIPGRIVVP